jgi:hypothetical protein
MMNLPARSRSWLIEQALMLAAYLLFAIALTWPLARNFSTRLVGHVFFDMRHALWIQWYVREALLGHVGWPKTTLLHYPYGINTLVDGVGPLNGVLGLPFWPWGPIAVFNGTALIGVMLSGWCLYLLARHASLDRLSAFIAGLLFMVWPIHLVALYGHLEKAFTGLLPLTLLAGLLALDLQRRWTILLPGLVLLAALLQNGNQFIFAIVGLAFLAAWLQRHAYAGALHDDGQRRFCDSGRRWLDGDRSSSREATRMGRRGGVGARARRVLAGSVAATCVATRADLLPANRERSRALRGARSSRWLARL